MIVVPFIPAHLEGFKIHGWQQEAQQYLNGDYADMLQSGPSYTAVVDGEVIAIAGVVQLTAVRWQAWALMSAETSKHMLQITREIKAFLDTFEGRLETPVLHEFEQGHRWMKILGFTNETPEGMKNYGDNGETFDLYARVKWAH